MITTKQKWGLGSLVTLAGAVWAPQVLEMVQGPTHAQMGIASGPDESEMLSIEQGMGGMPNGPSSPMTAPSNAPAPRASGAMNAETSGPVGGGGAMNQVAAVQSPVGSQAVISDVLRTLGRSQAFGLGAQQSNAFSVAEEDVVLLDGGADTEPEPSLFSFLKEQPLRGTIVGENVSIALIGNRRVRVGEIVPGTAATVVEIGRGRAVLEEDGMTIELELAPLETSDALMAEKAAAAATSAGTGAGPDAQGPIAGGSTQPGTAAPATNQTEQAPAGAAASIPLPQGDF